MWLLDLDSCRLDTAKPGEEAGGDIMGPGRKPGQEGLCEPAPAHSFWEGRVA